MAASQTFCICCVEISLCCAVLCSHVLDCVKVPTVYQGSQFNQEKLMDAVASRITHLHEIPPTTNATSDIQRFLYMHAIIASHFSRFSLPWQSPKPLCITRGGGSPYPLLFGSGLTDYLWRETLPKSASLQIMYA